MGSCRILGIRTSLGFNPCINAILKIRGSRGAVGRFKTMQDFGHQPSKRTLWSTCGKSPFTDHISSHGGAFCIGNSGLQAQVAAFLCWKILFTNSICCSEEHFVLEIPIYKLNWSVSCGLSANLPSVSMTSIVLDVVLHQIYCRCDKNNTAS